MGGQSAPMRVLIADDEPNVRQALWLVCEQALGFIVAAEAANATELLLLLKTTHPDLLLLEWGLPGADTPHLLREIATNGTLMMIVMSSDPAREKEALAAGASAFVYKGDAPEKLLTTLRNLTSPDTSIRNAQMNLGIC